MGQLTDSLKKWFDSNSRSRGTEYYHEGRVKRLSGDGNEATAHVKGEGGTYRVDLDLIGDDVLDALCECPYYEDEGVLCKHIWAVLLSAESKGLLYNAIGAKVTSDPDEFLSAGKSSTQADDDDDPFNPAALAKKKPAEKKAERVWMRQLDFLRNPPAEPRRTSTWAENREILYAIDAEETVRHGRISLQIGFRVQNKKGEWGAPNFSRGELYVSSAPTPEDQILLALLASRGASPYGEYANGQTLIERHIRIPPDIFRAFVPHLSATGRFFLLPGSGGPMRPLGYDDGPPWKLQLDLKPLGKNFQLFASLTRADGSEPFLISSADLLLSGGWVFAHGRVAHFDDLNSFHWVKALRASGPIIVPAGDEHELVATILTSPPFPLLNLPEGLNVEIVDITPRGFLLLESESRPGKVSARMLPDYDGFVVDRGAGSQIYDAVKRRIVNRNADAETVLRARLDALGFKNDYYAYTDTETLLLPARKLADVVDTLLTEGWRVEADGKLYRQPGLIDISVTSGVDWFELHGSIDFGHGLSARLPDLLAAMGRGDKTIALGDGTLGVLPADWLRKFGLLAGVGTKAGDHLRFSGGQAGFLDALLAAQPQATCDAKFEKVRQELKDFQAPEPIDAPPGFKGELRGYQREGLGWLMFLQRFGFGGCLADDMGLGKTIQVLALLENRRAAMVDAPMPSLVVVPRSLIFNWKQEAARFTPELKVLDHTGIARERSGASFKDYDVVLTTYGTLRRDIAELKDVQFNYVILDEAQSVKNAGTDAAKAVRLLKGVHRLCMSGTPVENHIGELWSLLEFLNPGMLGSAAVFQRLLGGSKNAAAEDVEARTLLARALRPFILRRTKDQVAKDLPQKTEQTIYCELEPAHRKQYNDLRDHYRASLLGLIDKAGLNKSKIQVLEALLRLRQAACHPGLLDKTRVEEPAAKVDTLLEQVREVLDEGHKALVFSQFTSLLSIVRQRLDKDNVAYEYLDGKTRDRESKVSRFQTDPDCKLFLISLKAGGLGLNLTAAEYVFLLDPWWNPAVEAQAIDRAHRIGQTRSVFAYRLIAKDTVEEKVLALQNTKRALADAIIGEDNSLIRTLAREDLELLLS